MEKVVQIMDDWCHTANIALVSSGKEMKYYLATENMKPGDLIRTSMHIPRIPGLFIYKLICYQGPDVFQTIIYHDMCLNNYFV